MSTSPPGPPAPTPGAPRPEPAFRRAARPAPDQPRRVQGGLRLLGRAAPAIGGWAGRRWLRVVEESALPERMAEGIEFARLGQTRDMRIEAGGVFGHVQDRAARPHRVRLAVQPLSPEQVDPLLHAMADQGAVSARLLAGEVPLNIEDLFAPLGIRLFPASREDLLPECDCADTTPWCRHACCLAILAAEQIDADPFLMLAQRGLPKIDLVERLRQRRAVTGSALGSAAAYAPRPIPGAESPAPPLESCLEDFWTLGPELEGVEMPLQAPEVSHALLRRLGPSPFDARFPLVGLLATCYDTISNAALRSPSAPSLQGPADGGGQPEA